MKFRALKTEDYFPFCICNGIPLNTFWDDKCKGPAFYIEGLEVPIDDEMLATLVYVLQEKSVPEALFFFPLYFENVKFWVPNILFAGGTPITDIYQDEYN